MSLQQGMQKVLNPLHTIHRSQNSWTTSWSIYMPTPFSSLYHICRHKIKAWIFLEAPRILSRCLCMYTNSTNILTLSIPLQIFILPSNLGSCQRKRKSESWCHTTLFCICLSSLSYTSQWKWNVHIFLFLILARDVTYITL